MLLSSRHAGCLGTWGVTLIVLAGFAASAVSRESDPGYDTTLSIRVYLAINNGLHNAFTGKLCYV